MFSSGPFLMPCQPEVGRFNAFLDRLEESRRGGAIHESVVEGQAERDHASDCHQRRDGLDLTAAFPRLVAELAQQSVKGMLLDGEIVAFDAAGKPRSPRCRSAPG